MSLMTYRKPPEVETMRRAEMQLVLGERREVPGRGSDVDDDPARIVYTCALATVQRAITSNTPNFQRTAFLPAV